MMSPRNASFGSASAVELMNSSEAGERPIASSASGSAGITPPLTVMQRKERPPSATIGSPAIRRLNQANAPSSR